MSFLKIKDPAKRDAMVKEYLELKKNIRDNPLSERTGELELQTNLSKFYRPITKTQKATAKEITEGLKPIREGLKPIREGIEKLPQAITFPTTQPLGEASGQEKEEEEEEEEEEKDDEELVGKTAYKFLNNPDTDKIFGVRKKGGDHYIGNKHVIIDNNDIILPEYNNERFKGTTGLWDLITSRNPQFFDQDDYEEYAKLMVKTNALYKRYNKNKSHPRSCVGKKMDIYTFPYLA